MNVDEGLYLRLQQFLGYIACDFDRIFDHVTLDYQSLHVIIGVR